MLNRYLALFLHVGYTFERYLRVFLLLVCLQLCSSHGLLADVTQRYVPPTVDLMCGEVGFRNIVLASEENTFRVIVLWAVTP